MRELPLFSHRRWRTWSCAVALLGLSAMSCGSEEEPLPPPVDELAPGRVEITSGISAGAYVSGQVTLAAVVEDNSGRVARVSFFVGARASLACADTAEKNSGSTFSCVWDASKTPEGPYRLLAVAQDAAGNTASSEPVSFFIGADLPPVISAVAANPTSVNEGQNTSLSATASDPRGDAITYTWTQVSPPSPVGTFTNGDTATPTWTAPLLSATTTFTLRVVVSDGKGGTTQRTVDLQVANVASANRAPVVDAAITAPVTVALAGETFSLSIGATDPDGDPLTYSWRTNPVGAGTFTNASSNAASWRSGDIFADTSHSLQVTVSDGVASVTRTVSVRATVPRYAANIQPIWEQCTSCHDSTSPSGGMNLLAGSSYSNLVGVNGNNRCGGSTALQRVRASQPSTSLLVRKIEGTCGTRMPQNSTNYFVDNPGLVTQIRSWILAGAPNN